MSEEAALLQALVAAEHAAVYGYGVLGAHLEGPQRRRAQLADDAHRQGRDELTALLQVRSAAVPAALPAYELSVASESEARAAAVRLEEGLAVRWRDLVAGTDDPGLRRTAVTGLTGAAVRAAQWRRDSGVQPATVALPGSG